MVNFAEVEAQLKRAGCNFRLWGRTEIKELRNILMPGETIAHCVNGRYEGGFALLCATDLRLLLVDRKPMFMSLEDIRFDMIAEIDYYQHLLEATVHIITTNRDLRFHSWSQYHLREVLNYTQTQVMDFRKQYMQQQFQPTPAGVPEGGRQTPPMVGGLALRAGPAGAGVALNVPHPVLPLNPYTHGPVMLRRKSIPKFY